MSTARDPSQTIDAEHPWPGLMPFTEQASRFFHGREGETNELVRLIEREPLSVLFGQSGLGKSSLLNAGVFPRLRRAGYLPIYLRLNLDDGDEALIDQAWQGLNEQCSIYGVSTNAPVQGDSLWMHLHRPNTSFRNPHGRAVVPVLVFDQFEELFTLGGQTADRRARCQRLLEELGQLIENRVPATLEAELTAQPDLLDDFDLLGHNLKIVFAFREDYLAEFEGLKTLIRPIMQNRMRLAPMSGASAQQAIQSAGGDKVSAPVANRIVRFVGSPSDDQSVALERLRVEPALLSLVCRELNDQRIVRGDAAISDELIQGAYTQQIIERFYRQGFADIDDSVQRFVEDRLLTAAGYRDSCALENALAEPGVSQAALQKLVDRRILRREERSGRVRLELIHDVLANVAKQSRKNRQAQQALLEAEQVIAEQRRQQRWLAVVGTGCLIILIGVSWLAHAAGKARDVAAEQARLADERTAELEQVSDFQAQMLAQINPTQAGELLTDDVMARLQATTAKSGLLDTERQMQTAEFAEYWGQINATDAARSLIDGTILKPAIAAIDEQFADQPLVDASLRQALASRYVDMGLYAQALPLQQRALEIRRKALGLLHRDTLISIDRLGAVLYYQSKQAEAEIYFLEALEGRRQALGADDPATLASISNVGHVRQKQGRYAEAEPLLREAMESYRRVLGEEHPDTLIAIGNYGGLLHAQGKLEEAELYYRDVLEKRSKVLGADHPDTLMSTSTLGVLQQAQGKLADAEPNLREALQGRRRVMGEMHPHTLYSISRIGLLLQAQGRLSAAEPYLREAADKRLETMGAGHLRTLIAFRSLGNLLLDLGRLEEAEPLFLEALTGKQASVGDAHPQTLLTLNSVGMLLQAQGRSEQTLDLLLPIQTPTREAFSGGNAYHFGRLLTTIGRARLSLEQFASAEQALLEAQQILLDTPGTMPQYRQNCLHALSELYAAWHVANPDQGYDRKAQEWQTQLQQSRQLFGGRGGASGLR